MLFQFQLFLSPQVDSFRSRSFLSSIMMNL
nr:MAG TPA: hypothetical protein [Caudoviricetes sp.]DAM07821.1 MAG TPA: hypothetical protein [Caudoviricetes sp.]